MRKIIFVKSDYPIKKLMIYATVSAVYLFLYDAVDDRPCISDLTFKTVDEAEQYCKEKYHANKNAWIPVSDPLPDCQYDFIMPKKIKGRKNNKSMWGQFYYLNGEWMDISASEKYAGFEGMSENGCLSITGLLEEFEEAKMKDPVKACKILLNLGLPVESVLYFSRS